MSYAGSDTWQAEQAELRAAEARAAAFSAAEQDAERISREFPASRPPDSPGVALPNPVPNGSIGTATGTRTVFARGQPAATSKVVTLRVSRLNSTPSRWIGSGPPRYLAA